MTRTRVRLASGTPDDAVVSDGLLELAPDLELKDESELAQLGSVRTLLKREQRYRRLLAIADSVAALGALVLVSVVWNVSLHPGFLLAPLMAILIAKIQGLYDHDELVISKSTLTEWRAIFRTEALVAISSYLVWYGVTRGNESHGIRAFALLVFAGFAIALPARALARRLARQWSAPERCLIVGAPERCERLAAHVQATPGVELIGTVSNAMVDSSVPGVHELAECLEVQRVIVGPHPAWREQSVLSLIQSAKWLGLRVSLMPTVMTVVGATTAIDELDSMVLLGVPQFGLSKSSALLKRDLDLIAAFVLALITAPVMAAIAISIRLDSHGPALFRQQRVGRDGRPFTMYKFRSMVVDADDMKADLLADNQTSGLFKLENDPRVTRVGRFLRRTYLDELPQLLNVLNGDMSLVGPRPLIASEDALLTGHDRHRSRLTPGMTGPWQLRGPLSASLSELARLDYLYASNWSVWKDIDVLLGTAARVFRRHGH